MKLVQVENLPEKRMKRKTNLCALIEEFIASDMDVCEIVFGDGEYKSVYVCVSTWRRAVERYGFANVKIVVVDKRAYICRIRHDKS